MARDLTPFIGGNNVHADVGGWIGDPGGVDPIVRRIQADAEIVQVPTDLLTYLGGIFPNTTSKYQVIQAPETGT